MLSYFIDFFRGEIDALRLIIYILSISYVVFCTAPLHEFAHAFVAVKLGDDTPRLRGRLTINPMAHIHPIGLIMIFLFGFGYARPVEIRMRNFKKPKRDMAIVALAGPVCNFLQAVVYTSVSSALTIAQVFSGIEAISYIVTFFEFAAIINIQLGLFNLIPVPPLDGSRLLTALLPSKAYYKIMQYERYITIGLMLLLFTGVLSRPLAFVSDMIFGLIKLMFLLPMNFIIG